MKQASPVAQSHLQTSHWMHSKAILEILDMDLQQSLETMPLTDAALENPRTSPSLRSADEGVAVSAMSCSFVSFHRLDSTRVWCRPRLCVWRCSAVMTGGFFPFLGAVQPSEGFTVHVPHVTLHLRKSMLEVMG